MYMAVPEAQLARQRIQELIHQHPAPPIVRDEVGIAYQDPQVCVENHRISFQPTGRESRRLRVTVADAQHNALVVIPVRADGRLSLVVRYRYASEKWSVEFPNGFGVAVEENWQDTACRTLLEKAGLAAARMHVLGGVHHRSHVSATNYAVVFAQQCEQVGTVFDTKRSIAGTVEISLPCLYQLIRRGDVDCSLTLAGLALYQAISAQDLNLGR